VALSGGAPPCTTHRTATSELPATSGTLFAWSELDDLVPDNVSAAGLATDSALSEAVQFGGTGATGVSN